MTESQFTPAQERSMQGVREAMSTLPDKMDRQAFDQLQFDHTALRIDYDRVRLFLKLRGLEEAFLTWNHKLN